MQLGPGAVALGPGPSWFLQVAPALLPALPQSPRER